MNRKIVRKPDGAQSGSGPTSAARRREFGALKNITRGRFEIKDSGELLKLFHSSPGLRLLGDVTITSDIWERFPYDIEIEGNLTCRMLALDDSLKVTGSINAAGLDIRGDLSAGSLRAGSVKSDGSVSVEGSIEMLSLMAKTASADTITGRYLAIAQHLLAFRVAVETLKAGSIRVIDLAAENVEVEYDLSCLRVTAHELKAGTMGADPPHRLAAEVGRKTLTGKTGRPWTDSGEQAGAPNPA